MISIPNLNIELKDGEVIITPIAENMTMTIRTNDNNEGMIDNQNIKSYSCYPNGRKVWHELDDDYNIIYIKTSNSNGEWTEYNLYSDDMIMYKDSYNNKAIYIIDKDGSLMDTMYINGID